MSNDEFISRAQAIESRGKARFPTDWGRWLSRRQWQLLNKYGLGPAPQAGTLHHFDYDPFEPQSVGGDYAELEQARYSYWLMRWQKERIAESLSEFGFTGPRFPRAAFEKAFPDAQDRSQFGEQLPAPSPANERRNANRRPARERAKRMLQEIYPHGIPEPAVEPNAVLCRKVGELLKTKKLLDVKDDTILRAANRRK